MSEYYVAQQGQDLYFFYPSDKSLTYRIWREGRLLPESILHNGIRLPFSVFHQRGQLHLFCQDTKGNILLFAQRNNEWGSRTVQQGGSSGKNVLITPLLSDDSMSILYNGLAEEDIPCLYKMAVTAQGPPEAIDHFRPFSFAPYETQATGPGHVILFYQNNTEDCQIGYREVTPGRTGPFHRFLNIKGTLLDASYLTTRDELHLLMIVKSAFSNQLLYRKKTEDVFTPPILLWEAPKIEQCLLTIIEGAEGVKGEGLHATCMVGGKPHRVISKDMGDSFGPMGLYKRKFCAEPVKASYVGMDTPRGWYARQVYVDRAAPWDIQMLPDL